LYSWSLWCLLSVLILLLQIKGVAGAAAYVTAAVVLLCAGVIVLSVRHGKKDTTVSDTFASVLGLVAIGFWWAIDQPVVSLVLLIVADLLAFVPTIRKSWSKPHAETLSLYVTNTLRFALALTAVKQYTLLSSLWLVVWVAANGLFALMLIVRRKQLSG